MSAAVPAPADLLVQEDLERVSERCRDAFERLRGARLFVTGGTGFIGTWLLESLVHASRAFDLGCRAAVLTRRPAAFAARAPRLVAAPEIELVEGDVRSLAAPAGRFTHVIHGATDASRVVNEERPFEMIDTIVQGTRRALDLAAASGARLLFLSSGAVYGPQPAAVEALEEGFSGAVPVDSPQAAYGTAKRLAEVMCCAATRARRTEAVIARCFAFVGPHLPLDAHYAAGNFIRDAIRGGPITLRGDGTTVRSYMYAADLAAWLWRMLASAPAGRPYNVGSPAAITTADLARRIAALVRPEPRVEILGRPIPGAAPDRYVPSVRRAEAELGLTAGWDLDAALRRTIAWARATGAAGDRQDG